MCFETAGWLIESSLAARENERWRASGRRTPGGGLGEGSITRDSKVHRRNMYLLYISLRRNVERVNMGPQMEPRWEAMLRGRAPSRLRAPRWPSRVWAVAEPLALQVL